VTWIYRGLFPDVLAAKANQFVLEFANREMAEIELWREIGADREFVDQKSFYIETPEGVAERIRIVLKYVSVEKI